MELKTIFIVTCMVVYLDVSDSLPEINNRPRSRAWKGKRADIYFLVDTSGSVWSVDYVKMLNFVAGIVEEMDIGPQKTRVGVGMYEAKFHRHITIDNTHSKDALARLIKKTPYIAGNGFLSEGIQGIRHDGLSPNVTRPGVPHIAVVFTDGRSRYKQLTLNYATMAKNEGIFLFMVGVGKGIDEEDLNKMASDPNIDHFLHAKDFDSLNDIRAALTKNVADVEIFQGDKGTCGDSNKVDTVFVYDESALGRTESLRMSQFMALVADTVSMGTGNVRLAAISASCGSSDFMLGHFVRREKLKERLFLHSTQRSVLPDLVTVAGTRAFLMENGGRSDSLKRIVVVMDRMFTMENTELLLAMLRAKYDDIQMFVIQLGSVYDKTFGKKVATRPDWAFYYKDMSELIFRKAEFCHKFCEDI